MIAWSAGPLAVALLALAGPAPGAPSGQASPPVAEILARAKDAQGGAAWDDVRSLRVEGTISVGGLEGPTEGVTDVRTGRYHETFRLGPLSGASGYDGREAWSQDSSGESRVEGADTPRQTAVTEAYRRARAWWYPERHAADIRSLGERREGERLFQVLAITPAGGRAFELWVDAATWLFDRTREQIDADTFITYLEDWREEGGVKLPRLLRTVRVGDEGKHDQRVSIARVERDVPVEDARFALPAPPPPDSGFADGKTSTTVPFAVANGHIYVDAKLNGRPVRLLLDSGGANIVTPAVAGELGLESRGELPIDGVGQGIEDTGVTQVDRVEIGAAFVERQTFMVYAIDKLSPAEGVPEQGLVGYEVFRRFVVRIDYEHQRLTLLDPATFRYRGSGAVIPFLFNEHIPQVDGEIDGLPGRFDLDTGSRSSLDLMSPFVARHGLLERWHAGPERIGGWGVGGPSRTHLARAHLLKLGPVEIPEPVTGLSTAARGFANPDVAGNVGYGVLARFTVTFVYARRQVILEKNGRFARRDSYDKSGLWLHAGPGGFEVMEVVTGTPAARAGLAVGDRIVAVDGRSAASLTLPGVRTRLRERPAGSIVRMRVERGGKVRTVRMVLADLV